MVNTFRGYRPYHETTENYQAASLAMAEGRLSDSLFLFRLEPPESPCYSLALGNAGLIHRRLGQYEEAVDLSRQALMVMEIDGCPHPPSWIQFARNCGEALVGKGDYVASLEAFNDAVAIGNELIRQRADDLVELELQIAHTLNSWGTALLFWEKYDATVDILRKSLDIYCKYLSKSTIGYAESLTNYALALNQVGKKLEAVLALREALPIAQVAQNHEQLFRIGIAFLQIDPEVQSGDDAYAVLNDAVDQALVEGPNPVAFVRLCILADHACNRGDYSRAKSAIERAKGLEVDLPVRDPNPAKLRMLEARVLIQSGAEADSLVEVLIEGARLWFHCVQVPMLPADRQFVAESMHDHFRLLTHILLQLGRIDEALTAFEAGRDLSHAVALDSSYLAELIDTDPFRDGTVTCNAIHEVQDRLEENQVILVPAVLPPRLVVFIVGHLGIQTVTTPLPPADEAADFEEAVRSVAAGLQQELGSRVIPEVIHDLGMKTVVAVGGRSVVAIMPHSILHMVPWRALLRHQGMAWNQLECGIEFGLFPRRHGSAPWSVGTCQALGHGFAGTPENPIDFRQEARAFSDAFGDSAIVVENCSRQDVTLALSKGGVVLLSCHGRVRDRAKDLTRMLALADGEYSVDDVFPQRVACSLVVLSACESGVYYMQHGDFPIGAAPELIRLGARYCVGARFELRATFSERYFGLLGQYLHAGEPLAAAFARASRELADSGEADLWRDLACIELLGGP